MHKIFLIPAFIAVGLLIFMSMTGCGSDIPTIGEYNVTGTGREDTCNNAGPPSTFESVWTVAEADLSNHDQKHMYYLFPSLDANWVLWSDNGKFFTEDYVEDFGTCAIIWTYSTGLTFSETEKWQRFKGVFTSGIGGDCFDPCKFTWNIAGRRGLSRD